MKRDDIALIIHDTILNFPKKIEKPEIEFLPKRRFSKYLDLLETKKHVNFTPCFVAQMKGGRVIYFCKQTVVDFVSGLSHFNQRLFIEAVTLHELFHVWNDIQVRSEGDLVFSEALVHEELREMFPKHSLLLEKFKAHKDDIRKVI
jgi:hypothetical protein